MLQKDLFKLGKKIVVEGSKSVAFGVGVNVLAQSVALVKKGDAKFGTSLLKAIDITMDTLID